MATDKEDLPEEQEQIPGTGPAEEGLPAPPVFMLDSPPTTGKKMDLIKWGLMHNRTEEELVGAGFNAKTVRMAAYDLEKEGYRKRPPKTRASTKAVQKETAGGTKSVASYGSRAMANTAKGLPPEFLIDNIELPFTGNGADSFEKGMKFGASMLVLGVRVAQELSNMGLQQARPIMDMANEMRKGEAAVAQNAALEAGMVAAEQVKNDMLPLIAGLNKTPASSDPMKGMLARMFEPMLQKMMGMFMPGMTGQADNVPQGWTRSKREV
jgi:hypothetical protein